MTDARQAFSELKDDAGFRRVDAIHVLDLYYGYDPQGRATLLLVSSAHPQELHPISNYFCGDKKAQRWKVGTVFCTAATGIQRPVLQLLQ